MAVNQNRDEQIGGALNNIFSPSKEPVMWGTVLTSAVVATLNYADVAGYKVDNQLLAVVIVWLNVLGLLVRSQYTPYANRKKQGA